MAHKDKFLFLAQNENANAHQVPSLLSFRAPARAGLTSALRVTQCAAPALP